MRARHLTTVWAVLVVIGLVGCAAEPEHEWFTAQTETTPGRLQRVWPMVQAADYAAVNYLTEMGYKDPVTALAGYDRAFLEDDYQARQSLWVNYSRRNLDTDQDSQGMGHFTVIVDQETRRTTVKSGR